MDKYEFISASPSDTKRLADLIARTIVGDFVIGIDGDVGSGKTTLIREILMQMGVTDRIKSPSFTIVEPYEGNYHKFYHFDLYRLRDRDQWYMSGYDEYFEGNEIRFVEWATQWINVVPRFDWLVYVELTDELRTFVISPVSELGKARFAKLVNCEPKI